MTGTGKTDDLLFLDDNKEALHFMVIHQGEDYVCQKVTRIVSST